MNQSKQKLLKDLFWAYYDARKNKRQTFAALKFEDKFEENIFRLAEEILAGEYEPERSICFVVNHPVKREIFAADFRDRIVHHLIYNYINPIFERHFIHDAYSCRKGKGTHFGIKRIDKFIRSSSENYQKDCWILKLDIKGYFMSMDKKILFNQVKDRLERFSENNNSAWNPGLREAPSGLIPPGKIDFDLNLVLELIQKTIFADPTKNCKIKGKNSDWQGLPKDKSLFHCSKNKGLPIGNLTSQLFGNVYLNDFDHFMKKKFKCRYYGRYVDDLVIIHQSKDFLKKIIPEIQGYLRQKLFLKIHEKKIYLQHFSRGVDFLGAYVKPHRIYYRNKNKGNIWRGIAKWSKLLRQKGGKLEKEEVDGFCAFINSILGTMKHFDSFRLRKKILTKEIPIGFFNYFYIDGNYEKLFQRGK